MSGGDAPAPGLGSVRVPEPVPEHGEPTFAAAAVRLAGQAGVVFGWGPEPFWAATPAELAALVAVAAGPADHAPLRADELAALARRYPDG